MTWPTHKGGAGSRKTQAKTVVVATACSVTRTGANGALTSGLGCRIQASLHKAKCGATRWAVDAAACKAGAQQGRKETLGAPLSAYRSSAGVVQAPCLQKYVQRRAALQATHMQAGAASATSPRSSSTQRRPTLQATRFIALPPSSSGVNNTQAHPAQLFQASTHTRTIGNVDKDTSGQSSSSRMLQPSTKKAGPSSCHCHSANSHLHAHEYPLWQWKQRTSQFKQACPLPAFPKGIPFPLARHPCKTSNPSISKPSAA